MGLKWVGYDYIGDVVPYNIETVHLRDETIQMISHYAIQGSRDFCIKGPIFKPQHECMAELGFPIGTVGWYSVIVSPNSTLVKYQSVFSDTFINAAWNMHHRIVQRLKDNQEKSTIKGNDGN